MINIDSRFLRLVDGDHMWLILNILDMANPSDMSCFPSNKTLCKKTKWNIKKLQRVKEELILKGLLKISARKHGPIQSSNLYTIDSELLGIYVPAKQIVFPLTPAGDMPLDPGVHIPPTPKRDNEVLTTEVLETTELRSSGNQEALFVEGVGITKPEGTSKKKKSKKPVDECFADFRDAWFEAYPVLSRTFGAVDGKMLNKLIGFTRTHVVGSQRVPTREAVTNAFKYVLAYVKRENHFVHEKPLTTWAGQYSSIIQEVHNGKKQKGNRNSASSIRDWARNL